MAREHNFLLGNGERLTNNVLVPKGGAQKKSPYGFEIAQKRIAKKLTTVIENFFSIPEEASPNGKTVAVLTMHPRYVSKSDYPQDFLKTVGLQTIGSRSRSIKPERWGVKKHPDHAVTDELFVVGTRDSFNDLAQSITTWNESSPGAATLTHIEDIKAFLAADKLRGIPNDREEALFEVVMHNAGDRNLVSAFFDYAKKQEARVLENRSRDVRGLTFIPVYTRVDQIENLAKFTLVRVIRGMPELRPLPTNMFRSIGNFSITLPKEPALDSNHKAVIFDGGLSTAAQSALAPWVTYIEPPGIGPAVRNFQSHGLAVTSSFLFGPIKISSILTPPICNVDHVRVLDQTDDDTEKDMECLNALDRILKILDGKIKYTLVNISFGPHMAMDDEEITAWTAELDQRFADGKTVATIAAGNDGEKDSVSGSNRVQPPADGVNVLSVGAANGLGEEWKRSPYSCVGPGRSPGIVKPDGVSFGGKDKDNAPFMVLDDDLQQTRPECGTSFAAPYALRSAASIAIQSGMDVNALAIRALLIHRAERNKNPGIEVGWGRFENAAHKLITCDDDEVLVLYKGVLPVGNHLRAKIPVLDAELTGRIVISATLVIAPDVDPENPGSYTRAGLEVALRPHSEKYSISNGKSSRHAKTVSFFSASNMYSAPEYQFREGGHKWEPCIRNSKTFQAKSLKEPCFDIYYHQRENGAKSSTAPEPIPYALVVSVKAFQIKDFYNKIVRSYSGILLPIRPKIRIPT